MNFAGELEYPTDQDVANAVDDIRANVTRARQRLASQFAHWFAIADDGVMPPLECN